MYMTFPAPALDDGAGARTPAETCEPLSLATGGEAGCSPSSSADGSRVLVNMVALELMVPKMSASAT
ncbi:uncharacterized protein M421DRAFT_358453 [Didymella exigua CBS 183.55]|uniref:Uncharacterized protein n=1 Tax=Didymella exigua CBS 183.55 TaxID=1150837 RepID=A0A6A5RR02_9PLEO|nr:uncharacterized protein M421DRAFT_358453 [Didymella exigua CBS 183.55]KAF1930775.1 hypothetical protein M421DRAFT_358453 [Didymella exigua CBS 183.55]